MVKLISHLLVALVFFVALVGAVVYYAWLPTGTMTIHNEIVSQDPLSLKKPDQRIKQLTVVTYNIGYAYGLENNKGGRLTKSDVTRNLLQMIDALRQSNPDILFLQEVDFHSRRTYDINQAVLIANALNMPYSAHSLTWDHTYLPWPFWPISSHYGRVVSGQVVMSRFPIVSQDVLVFDKPQSNPFWYNWFYLDRVVQKITLLINNQRYSVFHVHLEAFDEKARQQQTARLSRWVSENRETALLAAGDFNSTTNIGPSLSIREANELLASKVFLKTLEKETLLTNAETANLLTYPSDLPQMKLDHIFYSSKLKPVKTTVLNSNASDHAAVLST